MLAWLASCVIHHECDQRSLNIFHVLNSTLWWWCSGYVGTPEDVSPLFENIYLEKYFYLCRIVAYTVNSSALQKLK